MTVRILTAFIPSDLPIINEYVSLSNESGHSFYGIIVTCVYQHSRAADGARAVVYEVSAARLWEHINTYNLAYKESKL